MAEKVNAQAVSGGPGFMRKGQKYKSLLVWQVLLKRSDEEHPLSVDDIQDHLRMYGVETERRSIYRDMTARRRVIQHRSTPKGEDRLALSFFSRSLFFFRLIVHPVQVIQRLLQPFQIFGRGLHLQQLLQDLAGQLRPGARALGLAVADPLLDHVEEHGDRIVRLPVLAAFGHIGHKGEGHAEEGEGAGVLLSVLAALGHIGHERKGHAEEGEGASALLLTLAVLIHVGHEGKRHHKHLF